MGRGSGSDAYLKKKKLWEGDVDGDERRHQTDWIEREDEEEEGDSEESKDDRVGALRGSDRCIGVIAFEDSLCKTSCIGTWSSSVLILGSEVMWVGG